MNDTNNEKKSILTVIKSCKLIRSLYFWLYNKRKEILSVVAPGYLSKWLYKSVFHRKLNLDNPRYINEKLMWLKLNVYANDSLVAKCADKYAVRSYIKECGLENILNNLLGVWERAEDIDWEKLPNRFVLKCNHGCGLNIICRDKASINTTVVSEKLNKWLKKGTWKEFAELQYKNIPPRIICEEFLEGKDGALPVDYKVYCYNGRPLYIGNFIERDVEAGTLVRGYFDLNWKPSSVYKYPIDISKFSKPKCLNEMIEYAKVLSKPFPFVRVDFYEVNGKVYFGELTFTPTGCIGNYYADDAYLKLGNELDITQGVLK